MRRALLILIAASLAGGASGLRAHGVWPPKHGGVKNNDEGEISFELVARGRDIVIYLEDHGEPMSTAGARGLVELRRGDSLQTTELTARGGNRLGGRAPGPLRKGDRLIAKLTFANGSIGEGHFLFN